MKLIQVGSFDEIFPEMINSQVGIINNTLFMVDVQ